MSTRLKIHTALREGQRRGLKGAALERFVGDHAEVSRMTPVEGIVASRCYLEMVYPVTRPARKQGRLPL